LLIFKLSSEKRAGRSQRRSKVKSTTPLDKTISLERQNMRESDRRPALKNSFSNLNRDLKCRKLRLKITHRSLSLKRLEKSLWQTKGWLSRSKRV